ncbi:uncharacterized protein LY79DRAFT_341909 [Colletotrichum navitas]|uniref:Uncharacterized protein n=1 Tax=Colletotrichum navitas TaxID=681940 RepID=A0AAD8PRK2_9PEZI|nr:uncharacterized protein LY79DRAFT_341909 [Colletotrichum navitas]KAK1579423.1 hypothetical protein LY79DRAFT_341909 [Colletotrichum navitas]
MPRHRGLRGTVTLTKSRRANPMAGDGFTLLSPTLRTWWVALGSALHPNPAARQSASMTAPQMGLASRRPGQIALSKVMLLHSQHLAVTLFTNSQRLNSRLQPITTGESKPGWINGVSPHQTGLGATAPQHREGRVEHRRREQTTRHIGFLLTKKCLAHLNYVFRRTRPWHHIKFTRSPMP